MLGWLGIGLAVAFGLIAGHRVLRRDAPGALMALGMAWMAWMGYPHGPAWAAVFVALALWPLLHRRVRERCTAPTGHAIGGLAMVAMCLLPMPAGGADGVVLAGNPGHHHGGGLVASGLATTAPLTACLAVTCWVMAGYFLLSGVATLTRRTPAGTLSLAHPPALSEALMALGTATMLVAMT